MFYESCNGSFETELTSAVDFSVRLVGRSAMEPNVLRLKLVRRLKHLSTEMLLQR